MFSVQFYKYNSTDPIYTQVPLKAGDVIEAVEFNQTTQLYDIKFFRDKFEV